MRVGDLVFSIKRDDREYGIVVNVISETLVIVLWADSERELIEVTTSLEILNE